MNCIAFGDFVIELSDILISQLAMYLTCIMLFKIIYFNKYHFILSTQYISSLCSSRHKYLLCCHRVNIHQH